MGQNQMSTNLLTADGQIEFGHLVGQSGLPIPLAGRELVVGRSANDCDLSLSDAIELSKQHARFVRSGRRVTLEDLNSTNGTFVNGTQISAPVELQSGDRIRFGNQNFQYSTSEIVQPVTTAPEPIAEEKKWFTEIAGISLGPLTDSELQALAQSGRLEPSDMIHSGDVFRSRAAVDVEILHDHWRAQSAPQPAVAEDSTPTKREPLNSDVDTKTGSENVTAASPAGDSSNTKVRTKTAPAKKKKPSKQAVKKQKEQRAAKIRARRAAEEEAVAEHLVEQVLLADDEPVSPTPVSESERPTAVPVNSMTQTGTPTPTPTPAPAATPAATRPNPQASAALAAMSMNRPRPSATPNFTPSSSGFSVADLPWKVIGIVVCVGAVSVAAWMLMLKNSYDPGAAHAQLVAIGKRVQMLEQDNATPERWANLKTLVTKETAELIPKIVANAKAADPASCALMFAGRDQLPKMFDPDREKAKIAMEKFLKYLKDAGTDLLKK